MYLLVDRLQATVNSALNSQCFCTTKLAGNESWLFKRILLAQFTTKTGIFDDDKVLILDQNNYKLQLKIKDHLPTGQIKKF